MNLRCKSTIFSALGLFVLASIPRLAPAATLTINGCETLTVETNGTVTCNTAAPVAGAPTGCTVTPANVQLPNTGGQVNAPSISCTGGGAVVSTTWSRAAAGVTFPVTLPANALSTAQTYSYSGSVCAAGNLCTTVSYSATVAAASVVTPPTTASCGSLKVITPTWEGRTVLGFDSQVYRTSGFAGNDTTIAVAKIEVPAGVSGTTTLEIYEFGGPATNRKAWLSKNACDMSNSTRPYYFSANGPVFPLYAGAAVPATKSVYMQAGEVWYLMIKNESFSTTGSSCKSGTCEIGVTLKPFM